MKGLTHAQSAEARIQKLEAAAEHYRIVPHGVRYINRTLANLERERARLDELRSLAKPKPKYTCSPETQARRERALEILDSKDYKEHPTLPVVVSPLGEVVRLEYFDGKRVRPALVLKQTRCSNGYATVSVDGKNY